MALEFILKFEVEIGHKHTMKFGTNFDFKCDFWRALNFKLMAQSSFLGVIG